MAEIMLAIGTTHSPQLNSPAEDYPEHAAIDASGHKLLGNDGKSCTYGDLLAQADSAIKQQLESDVLEQRSARCTENIARIAYEIAHVISRGSGFARLPGYCQTQPPSCR